MVDVTQEPSQRHTLQNFAKQVSQALMLLTYIMLAPGSSLGRYTTVLP